MENGYIPSDSGGARQRRSANGNYSSISTQKASQYNSYDADVLKKKSISYSTPTFNTLSQRSAAEDGGGITLTSCFHSTAHITEGPNQPYYRDNFNDQPYSCDLGTGEENGMWMNTSDQAGTIMAFLVWLLLGYSAWTFTALAMSGGVPPTLAAVYVMLCVLALASHAKTTFSDPGSVPQAAVPNERMRREMGTPDHPLSMCSQCQTFKPPHSHHCRICNRCITRMDHHCPWVSSVKWVLNYKFHSYQVYILVSHIILCLDSDHCWGADEQLCGNRKSETFHIILILHVDLFSIFITVAGVELLYVRR